MARGFFYWTEPPRGDKSRAQSSQEEGDISPIKRQRSSGVEQRTHKPFVGGSIPPVATTFKKP